MPGLIPEDVAGIREIEASILNTEDSHLFLHWGKAPIATDYTNIPLLLPKQMQLTSFHREEKPK